MTRAHVLALTGAVEEEFDLPRLRAADAVLLTSAIALVTPVGAAGAPLARALARRVLSGAMAVTSAGILLWRRREALEVLLVHPGGPFWARKDEGAWSIPKGECEPGESPRERALIEFAEETGAALAEGELRELGEVRQKSGKLVVAFAREGDLDPATLRSNTFEMEWPPRSGRRQAFPEVDRAEWFSLAEARRRINPAQAALLDRLQV